MQISLIAMRLRTIDDSISAVKTENEKKKQTHCIFDFELDIACVLDSFIFYELQI